MTTPPLSIWSILVRSLIAPFSLSTASWKGLLKPVLTLVVFSALLFIISKFSLNPTLHFIAQIPVWASIVWFALDYQRHLVTGPLEPKSEDRMWPRYGAFFLVLVFLGMILALLLGLLLYMVLPAIVWFAMAINSPKPWLAAGSVLIWILVVGAAAYPVVRFAMTLPAIAAKHEVTPKRIWNLSQGRGIKLLILLVLIPGLITGFMSIAFEVPGIQTWIMLLVGILETYLALCYLSILAIAYGELTGRLIPAETSLKSIVDQILSSRFLWPSVLMIVAGIGLAAVFDAVYKVEPGQQVIISRFGKPDRVKSISGLSIKIPFIEQTKQVSENELYKLEGNRRFFTVNKESVSIKYGAFWHVVNAETYLRTTASQTQVVNRRIEHLLQHQIRDKVSRLPQKELQRIIEAGSNKFSIENDLVSESFFDAVLKEVNARVNELGIEMTAWHFESS